MSSLKKKATAWLKAQDLPYTKIVIAEEEPDDDLIMGRTPEERNEAETVGRAIIDVVENGNIDRIKVPGKFEKSIRGLWFAVHATHLDWRGKVEIFRRRGEGPRPSAVTGRLGFGDGTLDRKLRSQIAANST